MDKTSPLYDEQHRQPISLRLADQGIRVLHQFTATISFQIRTPLMAIIGYSDLLLAHKAGPLEEKQYKSLTHLRHSAGDLLHLIDEIKKFREKTSPSAKKQSGHPALFTSDIRNLQYSMSGVVHEMRSPLTAIIGSSAFLLSSPKIGPLNDTQREYLTSIQSIAEQLLEVVNELLDVYYLSFRWFEVTVEEIDLSQLIQGTISTTLEHWSVGKRSIEPAITPNLAGKLPLIWGDRRGIQQAITQILLEMIRTIPDDEPGEILLAVTPDGSRVNFKISVRGQSKGLTFDDHNPRLFFSRCIFEMHGGQLELKKQEEIGSTIIFSLPTDQNRPRH